MKNIKRKNKQKFDLLLKVAKENDLPLNFYIELKKRFNESKLSHRLKVRHGEISD